MFFKHVKKIYKYMNTIERGNKEAKKDDKDEKDKMKFYSDCLGPLNKYVRETYNDNESSNGSLITTMTSNFSEHSILKAHHSFSNNINKGSTVSEIPKKNG